MDPHSEADAKLDEDRWTHVGLKPLRALVAALEAEPETIQAPELAFFRDFLQSWGAKLPAAAKPKHGSEAPKPEPAEVAEPEADESEEEEEPDEPEEPEEEDSQRLPEDPEPYPALAPVGAGELADEQLDAQSALKQEAAEALEEGRLGEALQKYSEAIQIGNPSAMMYAKRAEVLLKLKRPNACVSDCTAAIGVNPDSAKAYRIRGKAHRALGHWEDAHKDLAMGQKLDYDEGTADVHKFVDDKWKRISERQTRKRLREENLSRKRREREVKRRRKEARKAYEEAKRKEEASKDGPAHAASDVPSGFRFGMGRDTGGERDPSTPGPTTEEMQEDDVKEVD